MIELLISISILLAASVGAARWSRTAGRRAAAREGSEA